MVGDDEQIYTPAQICKMFDVSKSTLFRWEREGHIPPAQRDWQGYRQYTSEHVQALLKKHLDKLMSRGSEGPATQEKLERYTELASLQKFINGKDKLGLSELAEHESLSAETIYRLLQEAQRYDPSDEMFGQIIELVYNKTRKR